MKKTKTTISLKISILVIALISVIIKADAKYVPASRNLCSLGIYPYNPTATVNNTKNEYDKQWFNLFDQSDPICNNHLQYGNAYKPQPPISNENPLTPQKNPSEIAEIKAPYAIHNHTYFNDSIEDSGNDNNSFYYKSYIDKFQITLAQDALNQNNFDNFNIVCYTPGKNGADPFETKGCNGKVNEWGGTTISFNKNTGVITWEFGVDSTPKSGRPMIFGNNPTIDSIVGKGIPGYNSANDFYRAFPVSVRLLSKNSPDQIWSGTTNSKVLLRDVAILKSAVDLSNKTQPSGKDLAMVANPNDKSVQYYGHLFGFKACPNDGQPNNKQDYHFWCTLPTPSPQQINGVEGNETIDGKNYYWFRIGPVSTVWKKPTPPKVVQECNSITVTPDGTFDENNVPSTFTLTGETKGGLQLDYKLEASQKNIVSFDGKPYNGIPLFATSQNDQKMTATTKVALNGKISNDLTLIFTGTNKLAHDQTYEKAQPLCQKTVVIKPVKKPPVLGCTKLEIQPAGPFKESEFNQNKLLTLTPTADVSLKYLWKVSNNNVLKLDNKLYSGVAYEDSNELLNVIKENLKNPIQDKLTLTVEGVNALTNENYGLKGCNAKIEINPENPPPEDKKVCQEFQIFNKNKSSMPDSFVYGVNPVDNMYLELNKNQPGKFLDVNYGWHTDNGKLNGIDAKNTFMAPSADTKVNLTDYDPSKPTHVAVTADAGDTPTTCTDSFTINPLNPPPPVVKKCNSIKLFDQSSKEISTKNINLTEPETITFSSEFDPAADFPFMVIHKTGAGSFESFTAPLDPLNICNSFLPSKQIGEFSFKAPSSCKYTFSGLANSHVDIKPVNPKNLDISACQANINVQAKYNPPPPGATPYCQLNSAPYNGQQLCINAQVYNNNNNPIQYNWVINGKIRPDLLNNPCANVAKSDLAHVEVNGFASQCHAEHTPEITPIFPIPLKPTLSKSFQNNETVLTVSSTAKEIPYKLTFTAPSVTSASINDDISKPHIQGVTKPGDQKPEQDYIYFKPGSQNIFYANSGTPLAFCVGPKQELYNNCYTGNIGQGNLQLYKVQGVVTITYSGIINRTSINPNSCNNSNNPICEEVYINQATANYQTVDFGGGQINGQLISNKALVQIFCQYILTRAAGDIFLEKDLKTGIDIRQCSAFKSTTGLIVKPTPPPTTETPSTGMPVEKIFTLSHEICSAGQAGELTDTAKYGALKDFYGKDVSNLSSQICEVKLQPGSQWKTETIANNIQENKTRISRWSYDYPTSTSMSIIHARTDFNDKNVFHIKGNLTIDQTFTLKDGEGAKTFIVEGGNLIINNDILYGNAAPSANVSARDTASLAFIVLGGNVQIAPTVETISGVYYVQKDKDGGKLESFRNEESPHQLKIFGSVYGDIEPLFEKRTYSGDPAKDQGGIVIRFDERIILNTPPGLRDILDVTQTEVAR